MKISRVKLHEGVQCGPDFKTFLTGDLYDITLEDVSGVHFMKVHKKGTNDVSFVSTINIIWFTLEEKPKGKTVSAAATSKKDSKGAGKAKSGKKA